MLESSHSAATFDAMLIRMLVLGGCQQATGQTRQRVMDHRS